MNWLRDFVLPKIGATNIKRDVPENMWVNCPSCSHVIFRRDLEENMYVCTQCDHHMRMPALMRFDMLLDHKGKELTMPQIKDDPLKFKDSKRYKDRLSQSRHKTKEHDAILARIGKIHDIPCVLAVMNFDFMGGSMGQAVGEGIVHAAQTALDKNIPFVMVASSGGARMQEGILSLMQMPRTAIAVEKLKEAGAPFIMVLADPTTGGVSASFAMLGDITIAEAGAIIGFAGARVIKETLHAKLPEGFQRAESLLANGMVDMVVGRHELKQKLAQTLSLLLKVNHAL